MHGRLIQTMARNYILFPILKNARYLYQEHLIMSLTCNHYWDIGTYIHISYIENVDT